jgi:UDP-glucuronate 4-epimerase
MRILITGAAGFIGFNLSNYLLKQKCKIFGIDNFDNYYSVLLKKKRIEILKKIKILILIKLILIIKNYLRVSF